MRTPNLLDLPPPPPDKVGWPWTESGETLPPVRLDGSPWPSMSIVTPSFNQGSFLEETIRSILLQGYPALQYFIIDGKSNDDSLAVIKKYEPWLAGWVSERDKGQADAVNKGLARCSGEIFQFINSDDYLAPGALRAVAQSMTGCHAVAGVVVDFDADGVMTPLANRALRPVNFVTRPRDYLYHQPGVWLRTELVKAVGGYDTQWRYKFDWVLQLKYSERWPKIAYIDDVLVYFRLHHLSKTVSEGLGFWEEEIVARELLYHSSIDPAVRAALTRFIRRRHWRARVDELIALRGYTHRQAVGRLIAELFQDPLNRIDRYSLGALRRLLHKCISTYNPGRTAR